MGARDGGGLRVEKSAAGLLHLVLDAGRGNVIDRALIATLRSQVACFSVEPQRRCLLLDHAGEDFSYGASVGEHRPEQVGALLRDFHSLVRELLGLDVPILAAVRGLCLGGGLELALLAERLCAAESAQFGQPEIELGVFAPVGSLLLPRILGKPLASELLFSGRRLGAAEARGAGLVAELSPEPAAAALAWARSALLDKSASSLRFATRAARSGWQPAFERDLERVEELYLTELMETRDAREGVAAFLEKRDPRWEDA